MQAFRLIVVVVLGLAIAVQTTAQEKDAKKSSVKEKLLGRWKVAEGNTIVEFARDGKYTVVITAATGKGITLEGAWKLLNDKEFQATLKISKRKGKTHTVEILKLTDRELVTKEGDVVKITLKRVK
jgi:uncharacterized protein (TIGR03066 family)